MLLSDKRYKDLDIPKSIDVDFINYTYKILIGAAGDNIDVIKKLTSGYFMAICKLYGKDVCRIPVEYLDYVFSSCSKCFDYRSFRRAINEFEYCYHMIVFECNAINDWRLDYLLIQKE